MATQSLAAVLLSATDESTYTILVFQLDKYQSFTEAAEDIMCTEQFYCVYQVNLSSTQKR